MTAPLLEIRGLTRSFGAIEVLRGVDLTVAAGESVAIVGPSGSGKSTLLALIGALLPPTAGTMRLDGIDLATKTADELAALRAARIGYVFQKHHLLPQCTALENVLVPTLALGGSRGTGAHDRARALLADVGLAERSSHLPGQLSGGECQRVAVVRALINGPGLVLADEPTGSLDAAAADRLADLLCEVNARQGVALITVTHSERIAARMQRRHELENGVLR